MYFAVVGIVAGYATVASMATERIAPNARFCISFDGTYAKSVQPSQCSQVSAAKSVQDVFVSVSSLSHLSPRFVQRSTGASFVGTHM
jgi:hypothetical protein